jgi:hypothetical protein
VLELRRQGWDPASHSIVVEPAKTLELAAELVPNARSVRVLTEPAGVEVVLDGRLVGTTEPAGPGEPASLLLEDLPLGEHAFTLSKPCHRTELHRELLAADLADNAPWTLGPVALRPVRSRLAVAGEPVGATVSIDGREVGALPLEVETCPGSHAVEVRTGKRRLWIADVDLAPEVTTPIRVAPRPNVVFAGAGGWPPGLERFAAGFNTIDRDLPLPAAPTDAALWRLAADVDLALAPVAGRTGESARWFAYSPLLGRAVTLDATKADLRRKPAQSGAWGLGTADSTVGGGARVVLVSPSGAAEAAGLRPGDRITSLGGAPIERADQVRGILRAAAPGVPLLAAWTTSAGEDRKGQLEAVLSARLEPSSGELEDDVIRAAWARSDAELDGDRGQLARAAQALLCEAWGRPELAVELWRRVELAERRGIGRGTVHYYLGRSLEKLGRTDEAVAAYRSAASSSGTVIDDEGPPVAPAARDRLAELEAR